MDRRFQYSEDPQNQGLDLEGVIILFEQQHDKTDKMT